MRYLLNKVWQLQWTMSQGKPEPQQSLLHTHHPLTKAAHPSYVVSETLLPPHLAYPWQTQVFADSKPCPGSRIWPEKPGHCNKVINFKFMIKLLAGIPTCNKIQSHCPSRPLVLLSAESEPVRERHPSPVQPVPAPTSPTALLHSCSSALGRTWLLAPCFSLSESPHTTQ